MNQNISAELNSNGDLHIDSVTVGKNVRLNSNADDTRTISVNEYRRLLQISIELAKANKTIDKLNILLEKKDNMIANLKKKLMERTSNPHLSSVSER